MQTVIETYINILFVFLWYFNLTEFNVVGGKNYNQKKFYHFLVER